ncbi:hypothetical protein JX266_013320 [Neoarthrinium moseri]|uniref:uncharacterized protein n=1 Tax=Neoarthrinium moseri TaxID=1658444 RepID=UPI001FDCD690|nr:uncharacterized protein JN550_001707 [Neoarthrinium moseri]KAI1840484.1 hypothetical protein JX266_013320 [Neoarthrinium moseri]KAI1876211.1 hypothetical protein JN550_001707 [Neoarthrinium moseri]
MSHQKQEVIDKLKARGALWNTHWHLAGRNWWKYKGEESYNLKAVDVFNVSKYHSLAGGTPDGVETENFTRKLRDDLKLNFESMTYNRRSIVLASYLAALDRLFFFGIITVPQPDPSLMAPGQPWRPDPQKMVITLRYLSQQPTVEGITYGRWWPDLNTIDVYSARRDGTLFELPQLVLTLGHEMTHAWLGIFAYEDARDRLLRRVLEVEVDGGHGRYFYEQWYFITRTLVKLLPEVSRFREVLADLYGDLQTARTVDEHVLQLEKEEQEQKERDAAAGSPTTPGHPSNVTMENVAWFDFTYFMIIIGALYIVGGIWSDLRLPPFNCVMNDEPDDYDSIYGQALTPTQLARKGVIRMIKWLLVLYVLGYFFGFW